MCYEELHIDVVVSCLTEALLKNHPIFWPSSYAVVVFLTLIPVAFCVAVFVVNRPPATMDRQLTLDSVKVSNSVTITISDSDEDDDDDSAMYRDYRHSLHQFADVLNTMPMQYPFDVQDRHPLITYYKRKYWRLRLVWGWLEASH